MGQSVIGGKDDPENCIFGVESSEQGRIRLDKEVREVDESLKRPNERDQFSRDERSYGRIPYRQYWVPPL
jgi:hypothetical protein